MIREEEVDLDVLMNYLDKRVSANKNWLNLTTGGTGSGKSFVDLRLAEVWYDYFFKEKFPMENCCFSIEGLMERITAKTNRPGELFILEEAGTLINSKDFQVKVNKLFNFYMQSFRCKNFLLLFNLPLMNMLDKSTRLLCHSHFITSKIVKTKEVCHIKPLFIQVNQDTGKIYRKYLRKAVKREQYYFKYPVKMIGFGLPSKELRKEYEKKKNSFVDTLGDNIKDTIREKNKVKGIPYRHRQVNTCFHKFNLHNPVDIAKKLSIFEKYELKQVNISRDIATMDVKYPNWRENPKEIGFLDVLAA